MMFENWWIAACSVESVSYSRFIGMLHDGQLKSVQVDGQNVFAELK